MKFLYKAVLIIFGVVIIQFTVKSNPVDSSGAVLDTLEYELIVFDPGYDLYLISQPPMEFYSISYYRSWNTMYVAEWNNRYLSQANDLYETYIDYNPLIDYDLELEYKLYYYFRFFEKSNNVTLVQRGK